MSARPALCSILKAMILSSKIRFIENERAFISNIGKESTPFYPFFNVIYPSQDLCIRTTYNKKSILSIATSF